MKTWNSPKAGQKKFNLLCLYQTLVCYQWPSLLCCFIWFFWCLIIWCFLLIFFIKLILLPNWKYMKTWKDFWLLLQFFDLTGVLIALFLANPSYKLSQQNWKFMSSCIIVMNGWPYLVMGSVGNIGGYWIFKEQTDDKAINIITKCRKCTKYAMSMQW